MGKSGEFYTFDEVLKYLQIPETKLKRLVSEGEIRAFREGDEMKFRRADVENIDLTGALAPRRRPGSSISPPGRRAIRRLSPTT